MDPQLLSTLVTGLVGLVGPVVGWLLRHYTLPAGTAAAPTVPVAQPVQPIVVNHPVLSAFERVMEGMLTQAVQGVMAQAASVSQVTVGVPAAPAQPK